MNAYFFPVSNEERENILNRHKEVYNGYKTLNPNPVENNQPLFVQDFANDKDGMVVNNKGEVKKYTNMGINESKSEVEEYFYYEEPKSEEQIKKDEKDREDDLGAILSKLGNKDGESDSDDEGDYLYEDEDVCEQCGLKESLCECGNYMEEEECDECYGMNEQDGGESSVEQIGDAIWGSGRIWELLKEYHPEDFSDEFEFADNMIHFLTAPYEDEAYYDELIDYIKEVYGEYLFDIYEEEMGNEFDFGDDEDDDEEMEYVTEQVNLISSELDTPMQKSAYSYISGGPDQYSGDASDEEEGYEADLQKIQHMFDYASQHDNDPDAREEMRALDKSMNKDFDGSEEASDNEWDNFDFISGGPPGVTFHEAIDEENDEEELEEKWSEKYKRSIDCNNPKGFSQRAHCQGKKKHTKEEKNVEEEIEEDLRESFTKQRNLTLEMFERFGRYN